MKQNFLIALGLILLVTLWIQYIFPNYNEVDRYSVVSSNNMLTVLVDKKTGLTWRNTVCDETSGVPGCWARMGTLNAEDFNMPLGEAVIRTKIWPEYQKKLERQELKKKREDEKRNRAAANGPEFHPENDPSLKRLN